MNSLSAAELKRRGMAAIEEGLRRGPVHLMKRNKLSAVVLTEEEYARLSPEKRRKQTSMTALQWLLSHSGTGRKSKAQLDKSFREERKNWT